jgi:radical SAM protein (TIGR01212 family)
MRCGIQFSRERYGDGLLELYIQAYTATYASARALREMVEPLLEAGDFVSLSLGTRPDCLPSATLHLLQEWNQKLEVWVELGVQSARDLTLEKINRRHDWAQSRRAIERLNHAGLKSCAHLLFGLPGETADDMFETLDRVTQTRTDALKLHNLHILKNSVMGEAWTRQPFSVLSETAWLELVMQLLRRTPATLPIFRVFTDSDPENRLAPPSEFSKGRFLHELAASMRVRGWVQGELCP